MALKERFLKSLIPALIEKFEPQLLTIIENKKNFQLLPDEEDIVLILHIENDKQLYASMVTIGADSQIKRLIEKNPVKDFLLKLSKAK